MHCWELGVCFKPAALIRAAMQLIVSAMGLGKLSACPFKGHCLRYGVFVTLLCATVPVTKITSPAHRFKSRQIVMVRCICISTESIQMAKKLPQLCHRISDSAVGLRQGPIFRTDKQVNSTSLRAAGAILVINSLNQALPSVSICPAI